MDLSKFPMDTQNCTLIYESFSYNNKEVDMRWRSYQPVTELKTFNLPDFELVLINTVLHNKVLSMIVTILIYPCVIGH